MIMFRKPLKQYNNLLYLQYVSTALLQSAAKVMLLVLVAKMKHFHQLTVSTIFLSWFMIFLPFDRIEKMRSERQRERRG